MKLKAISVMIIAGAAVLAAAQMGDNKPIGLDARVGAFFPIDSGTQGVGNTWLDLGLDFEAKKLSPSASLKVSLDYAYRRVYFAAAVAELPNSAGAYLCLCGCGRQL